MAEEKTKNLQGLFKAGKTLAGFSGAVVGLISGAIAVPFLPSDKNAMKAIVLIVPTVIGGIIGYNLIDDNLSSASLQ